MCRGRRNEGCRVSLVNIHQTSANVEGKEKGAKISHCKSVPDSYTLVSLYWKGRLKLNAVIQQHSAQLQWKCLCKVVPKKFTQALP